MKKNPFVPGFDIKKIMEKPAPPKAEKVARKSKIESYRRSRLSGFPTVSAVLQYLFAYNPFVRIDQVLEVMDAEYPYTYFYQGGEITEEQAKEVAKNVRGVKNHISLRVRIDENGEIMTDGEGRPLSRSFNPAHLRKYRADILGGKLANAWNHKAELGITDDMIEEAMKKYKDYKRQEEHAKKEAGIMKGSTEQRESDEIDELNDIE